MLEINLLPWRASLARHNENKKKLWALCCIVSVILMTVIVHGLVVVNVSHLQKMNHKMKSVLQNLPLSNTQSQVSDLGDIRLQQKNFLSRLQVVDDMSVHHLRLQKIFYQGNCMHFIGNMVQFSDLQAWLNQHSADHIHVVTVKKLPALNLLSFHLSL